MELKILPEQENEELSAIQTFLNKGATIEQSLSMVIDPVVRDRLRPKLFTARLRAAIVNAGCVLKLE